MNQTALMKTFLRLFLGFLGLTAFVAIVSILGGEFGPVEGKIICSALTITIMSICAMSCAAFITRHDRVTIGTAGIGLAVISAIMMIAGFWPEIENQVYWKITITFGVSALACAHGFLLILPDLGSTLNRWFRPTAFGSVTILALLVIVAAWGDIGDITYWRALAVAGIMVGLETVSLPILMKLNKDGNRIQRKLVLEKLDDGSYRDSEGRRYILTACDPEEQYPHTIRNAGHRWD